MKQEHDTKHTPKWKITTRFDYYRSFDPARHVELVDTETNEVLGCIRFNSENPIDHANAALIASAPDQAARIERLEAELQDQAAKLSDEIASSSILITERENIIARLRKQCEHLQKTGNKEITRLTAKIDEQRDALVGLARRASK